MLRVNPGSIFPEHEFAQLDRGAVERLVLGIDAGEIAAQLAEAEDLDALAMVPIAELIIKLLAENKDREAVKITNLVLRILVEGNSVFSGTIWQNIFFTVIPSAVVLEKFEFLDAFIESEMSDAVARSGLLAVAAQICLSKHHYERARLYLQKAKKTVASEPLVSTFSIDELMEYTQAKLSGDTDRSLSQLSCVHHHSNFSEPDWHEEENTSIAAEEIESPPFDAVLRKWQLKLGGKESDAAWTAKDDLAFLFQRFRPDGDGIKEFCQDLNCSEIASRLLDLFRATAAGFKKGNVVDAYFVVRRPPSSTNEEIRALAVNYCKSLKHVASVTGDDEMKSYFQDVSKIEMEIRRGETASLESSDIDISIYQALNDYFSHGGVKEQGALLDEALYTMANSYNLSNYVRWPLLRSFNGEESDEPYSKYFELWRRGVNPVFEDDGHCVLYTVE